MAYTQITFSQLVYLATIFFVRPSACGGHVSVFLKVRETRPIRNFYSNPVPLFRHLPLSTLGQTAQKVFKTNMAFKRFHKTREEPRIHSQVPNGSDFDPGNRPDPIGTGFRISPLSAYCL
jgi:hypothetical protein